MGPRPRVAVMNFDFGTVHPWWHGNWDIGSGISALVTNDLVRDGTYSVVDSKMIDSIVQQQNPPGNPRVDPGAAAMVGRNLGVNAIIVGSVTQFGFDDNNIGIAAGDGGRHGFGLGALGISNHKAIVVVDARIVDTNTGEILAVASQKGESSRSSFSGFGGGGGRGGAGVGGIDMGSGNFQNTIVGEATKKCVDALCAQLEKDAPLIASSNSKMPVVGRVADADRGNLVLNIGREQGLRVGDVLTVERVVREVKDPDTGRPLREIANTVGSVTLTEVDDGSAVGTFAGPAQPMVGDRVRR
jgi:curli biogenesis system outer membrane secretion channel CsgG